MATKPFIMRAWMIGQLRRIFKRYPPYYLTLRAVRIEVPDGVYKTGKKAGKPKFRVFYPCAKCGQVYKTTSVVVDHIQPVIEIKVGFPLLPDGGDDWVTYITRLFCDITNLQVLCHTCHDTKTGKEIKQRVKARRKKKSNQVETT